MEPGMAFDPKFYLRMFMRTVVVHDEMKLESGRCFRLDFFEEPDELLMSMAWHTIADDFAVEHTESGEQGGRAVALIIVRHGSAAAFFQRKTRLGPVESLDLAFLVHTQDQRPVRGIQIQAHDIAQFLEKAFISTEFESFDQMRLQVVLPPDSADGRFAEILGFSHGPRTPMRRIRGFRMQGRFNHGFDFSRRDSGDAAGPRCVLFQSRQAKSQEPLSPKLNRRSGNPQLVRDILVQRSFGRHSNDSGTLYQSGWKAPAMRPSLQSRSFLWRQDDGLCKSAH